MWGFKQSRQTRIDDEGDSFNDNNRFGQYDYPLKKEKKAKTYNAYRNRFWDEDDYFMSDFFFSRTYSDANSIVKNITTDKFNANNIVENSIKYINKTKPIKGEGKRTFKNEHLIMDAYSLFNDKNKEPDEQSYLKADAKVQHFVDYVQSKNVLKTFTNQNSLCSYMISRELYSAYCEMEEQDEQQEDQGGSPQGNDSREQQYDNALKKAYQQYQNIEQVQQQIQENQEAEQADAGQGASKLQNELDSMDTIEKFITGKKVNFSELKKFTKHLEGMVTNSFFNSNKQIETPLLDSDFVGVVNDFYGFVHPAFYEEMSTKEPKGSISFNIYVDRSGSMSGMMNGATAANSNRFDVAKLFSLQMYANRFVKEFYLFDDNVHKKNFANLLVAKTGGGTNINRVIADCESKKKYSIIITDGDDDIGYYSPYVYFVVFTDSNPLDLFYQKGVRDMYLSQNRILKCSSNFDLTQPEKPLDYRQHIEEPVFFDSNTLKGYNTSSYESPF